MSLITVQKPELLRVEDLRVEYLDITSTAEAHLYWSSASQVKQPIPTSQLYPSSGPYVSPCSPSRRP